MLILHPKLVGVPEISRMARLTGTRSVWMVQLWDLQSGGGVTFVGNGAERGRGLQMHQAHMHDRLADAKLHLHNLKCTACGKQFSRKVTLARHMKSSCRWAHSRDDSGT